jgi:hypothetical protein
VQWVSVIEQGKNLKFPPLIGRICTRKDGEYCKEKRWYKYEKKVSKRD